MNMLAPRPDDRPPQREEWGTGVTISVAAHLLLIAALVWGVHWHTNNDPEGVTAELWATVPQAAAPPPQAEAVVDAPPPEPVPAPAPVTAPPPPPPPPAVEAPRPPDIATGRLEDKKLLKKQLLEQAKLAQQKTAAQKPAEKSAAKPPTAPPKLSAQQLAKLHDDNVKRMLGQMDAPTNAAGNATRSAGPSAGYAGRIAALIKANFHFGATEGLRPPELDISLAPDGTIMSEKISKSSGSGAYDEAVLRAVIATGKLPRDTDGSVPSAMLIVFDPNR